MPARRGRRGRRSEGEGAREARPRRKGRRGILAFLLASAVPLGALGWWAFQTEERRREIGDRIPTGIAGRALAAGAAFGMLVLLARVALPAFFGASSGLRGVLGRMAAKPKAVRVLLFPFELVVYLLWLLLQMLFAVDAFLIVVAALVGLLLVVRIVKPDFLPAVLPELTR